MTNKEFDRWLRESLSSVSPDSFPGDWEEFVKRVEDSESHTDDADFDAAVRDSLVPLGKDLIPDWSRMEHLLDADEASFDSEIRDSIQGYHAPYNPDSWPILDEKLDDDERNRRRVIVAKALEITAVFVVILTLLNFFPAFQSFLQDKEEPVRSTDQPVATTDASEATLARVMPAADSPDLIESVVSANEASKTVSGESLTNQDYTKDSAASSNNVIAGENRQSPLLDAMSLKNTRSTENVSALDQQPLDAITSAESVHVLAAYTSSGLAPRFSEEADPINSIGLSSLKMPERSFASMVIPVANYPNPSRIRFSMSIGADVNTLYIPGDHFYSQGRSIRFSEKSIEAGGYTAGASLLFDKQKFLIEVGLAYSQKSFSPGRKFYLGTSPEQHSLDFDNITLNIVSLPINLHVKLDGKGAWRMYGIGGAAIHMIASANYDLITETTFASAAPQDPFQLQTEREIQRVKESMLDGAKFSSKGYLTANVGLGVERYVNGRTSIFAQPMYQYQIPFFKLIDQNGKHLKTWSLMLGTRISL